MFQKLFILLFACSCGITDTLAASNRSHLSTTKSCGCGVDQGVAMVQILTKKFKYISGTYWDHDTRVLYFLDRHGGTLSKYFFLTGLVMTVHFEELQDQEIASVYPIQKREHQYIITGNKTLYLMKVEKKDNDYTHTIKEVMKVIDGSQIIANTVTTLTGHLIITTKPENYKDKDVEQGQGQLLRLNMTTQKVETIDTGFDSPAGVCFDSYHRYLFVSDNKQGKIYQYKHNITTGKISDKKVIFDMEHYNLTIHGKLSVITMDKEGRLWIAMRHSYQVLVFDIHLKRVIHKIPIPQSVTSALTWAGAHNNILVLGSSRISVKYPKHEPAAGRVLGISGSGTRGFYIPKIYVPKNIE